MTRLLESEGRTLIVNGDKRGKDIYFETRVCNEDGEICGYIGVEIDRHDAMTLANNILKWLKETGKRD